MSLEVKRAKAIEEENVSEHVKEQYHLEAGPAFYNV